MTNILQPQLQGVAAPRDGRQVVESLDLGGLASAIGKSIDNFQGKKKAKEAARQEGVVSTFAQDVNTEQQGLHESRLFQQSVTSQTADIDARYSDGDVSEEDEAALIKYKKDINSLKQLQLSGNLNNDIYAAKIRNLESRALSDASSMTSEIRSITGSVIDNKITNDPAKEAQENIFQILSRRKGEGNVTYDDFSILVRQQTKIKDAQDKIALGTISATEVSTLVDDALGESYLSFANEVKLEMDTFGALRPHVLEERKMQIEMDKAQALSFAGQYFTTAANNGLTITREERDGLKDQITSSYDGMSAMLEGKDLKSMATMYVETMDAMSLMAAGPQFNALNRVMANNPFAAAELNRMLKDPALAAVMNAANVGTPGETNPGVPIDMIIAQGYASIAEGKSIVGDTLENKLLSIMVNTAIATGPVSERTTTVFTERLFAEATEGRSTAGAVKYLNSPLVAANLATSSTPETRRAFKSTLETISAQVINDAAIAFENLPKENLIFDVESGEFTSDFKLDRSVARQLLETRPSQGRGLQLGSAATGPLNRLEELMNLAEMSDYSDVMPSKAEMIRSIEKRIKAGRKSREDAENTLSTSTAETTAN